MATSPNFYNTPRWIHSQLSVGDTALDGLSDYAVAWSDPAAASYVDRIIVKAIGDTTAGMIRFFFYDGVNEYLWFEVPVQAVTPGATQPAWGVEIVFDPPYHLADGMEILATTHNSEDFDVSVGGGI
jgi:hypothetical protein